VELAGGARQRLSGTGRLAPFFAAVKPFVEQIEEMLCYQRTTIASPA
jgi:hypothetical protein